MKTNLTFLSLVGIVAILVSSCDLLKDVTYSVTPNPLELHGDNVKVAVTVTIPEKGIKKKAKVEGFTSEEVVEIADRIEKKLTEIRGRLWTF